MLRPSSRTSRSGPAGRRPSSSSSRAARSLSERLPSLLGAAREPDRTVLPVVRDERGAEGGEQDAGGAVVHPLPADPDAAAGEVEPDQPITVCPGTPHCLTPH